MINFVYQIPQYILFRSLGYPRKMPLSVTISVTNRCNSRCKTCNIWRKEDRQNELSIAEYESIFKSLGRTPYWFTLSGGEPFLRQDLLDICRIIYSYCAPGIINIATNGLLCDIIPETVGQIVEACPRSRIIVNLSLDGIGEAHNNIRGIPGNWDKVIKTYTSLRDIDSPNLEIGIHSVISIYNTSSIPEIYEYVNTSLMPDFYITEIAEERVELDTKGAAITPSQEDYAAAVDYISKKLLEKRVTRTSKITRAFRLEYYNLSKQILKNNKQVIPCYAGFASAHIAADGNVWMCCIKAETIGNLRNQGMDFKKVWFGEPAKKLRETIKSERCYCPLANASYTNMLLHPPTLARVSWRVLTT